MGPLRGITVIELAGIGPASFCGMLLADLGADVVRVERASAAQGGPPTLDPLQRNRRSIAVNLKNPGGTEVLLNLVAKADILIEGFRPGVTERLGIGPEPCLLRNPKLVYGRMTGWGQTGPLARAAGHDINYIALAGALHLIGLPGGKPVPPLNFVGDLGGGGMLLAFGVLAALLEARTSGAGQVVDAAMVDGTIALLGTFFATRALKSARDATGEHFLGGAAPWYDTYQTLDGRYVAIGALEPPFYALLLERLGLDRERWSKCGYPATDDEARKSWPELRAAIATAFASRTRDEWCRLLEGSDACFTPVLSVAEASRHPHNAARGSFITVDGVEQSAPVPRFSRTNAAPVRAPRSAGADTETVLREAGYTHTQIERLRATDVLS